MESAMHRSGDETEFDPFADLEVPEELEESIRRHRAHLSQLIRTMKIAGVSSDQIEESLSVVIASYKEELIRTIKALVR
jgi:hypothetical protein